MKKYVNGLYIEMTEEEIKALEAEALDVEELPKTVEERIEELEAQNETLLECLLEMSEIVYA